MDVVQVITNEKNENQKKIEVFLLIIDVEEQIDIDFELKNVIILKLEKVN
ncbi:MAG: hypothetical protein AB7E37_05980 [Candidatus Altimarinota bacterium]